MAGFLAAAGLIGGAASAAGHGLADSHKRAGDVGGADVIFQTATADDVFCLEHHCGFHFRRVLEKLGVINKESDTLDQTAARTHAATYGTGGYIPATSSYAGYQAYQPVTAPAGRSYVDQSKNEYHISLTGGTAPGTQLDRQLQDALEKYERDKRARARASMMHDG